MSRTSCLGGLGATAILSGAMLFSCTSPIIQNEKIQSSAERSSSASVEASRYTSNVLKLYHSFPKASSARAVSQTAPGGNQGLGEQVAVAPEEFFNSLKIFGADAQPVLFSDFSDFDKEHFLAYWAQITQELLQKDLEESPDLVVAYQDINDSMDQTLPEANRGVSNFAETFQQFSEKYAEAYLVKRARRGADVPTSLSRSGSSSSGGSLENVKLVNPNAVSSLRAGYAKGRVLISTAGLFGHASMMASDSFMPEWENDGGAMIAITSFAAPSGSKNYWGGPDGVQLEPLGAWAGKCADAAKQVKIIQPSNHCWSYYWQWDNWYSGHIGTNHWWEDGTQAEATSAVNYAISALGHGYCVGTDIINNKSPFIFGSFVCSSLVWRSWQVAAGGRIELDATWWDTSVTPDNIATTDDRKDVLSYSNS